MSSKSRLQLQSSVECTKMSLKVAQWWSKCCKNDKGITADPAYRFNTPSYAYSKSKTQLRDGVRYEGMHVVYIKESRSEIALAEHLMMNHFLESLEFESHCANQKRNLDKSFVNDDSDEERYDAKGPHSLYIAWGARGAYHRDQFP